MKKVAFVNGKVLNPEQGTIEQLNILLINNKVAGLGYLPDDDDECRVIDVSGCIIVPSIIDSFANLNEPGQEIRETFESASTAALRSGITAIACTPDTNPVLDKPELISSVKSNIALNSLIPVFPLGAVTKKTEGKELAELALMKAEGVPAYTDCRRVDNPVVMRNALLYSEMINAPLFITPYSTSLPYNGVMNEGYYSTILGLNGIPNTAEETIITRDIKLVEQYGGNIHFFPVTTRGSVNAIKQAREKGLNITCGTAPHYLWLTEKDVDGYDTNTKVYPPLRSDHDQEALISGIKNGLIDVLATDHTPLSVEEKRNDYNSASAGVSGLDLFLPLIISRLYHTKKIDLITIFKTVSTNPYKILNIKSKGISPGSRPSFSIIDLKEEKTVQESDILSKGKNTPFTGIKLKGFCKATVINGQVVFNTLPVQDADKFKIQ